MSKSITLTLLLATLVAVSSFTPPPQGAPKVHSTTTLYAGYIPTGFTEQQWKAFQQKESKKKKGNLGKVGPQGFTSRSMQSFQEAMESGQTGHKMPVFNFQQQVKSGKLKLEDVPVSLVRV